MKKAFFGLTILIISLSGTVYAEDYKWDLINALTKNNFEKIENILKTNIATMTENDKKLIMNFAINYTSGSNTLTACELLLKYNIRPGSFDLYTAINRNRQNAAIQFLLRNGAVPNGEILLLAMERQRFDFARQFIEAGIDVNYQYSLARSDADGMTPLLYASKWNNIELVKLLAEKGANINIRAVNGDTALSIAQQNNNEAIYYYLIELGATEQGNRNNTPLQNTGIANFMDNQQYNFQTGSYRLSGNNKYIRFTGNANSGSISYVDLTTNNSSNGIYRVTGNNITLTINGSTFTYRADSNVSFSGNGEVWTRSGN